MEHGFLKSFMWLTPEKKGARGEEGRGRKKKREYE